LPSAVWVGFDSPLEFSPPWVWGPAHPAAVGVLQPPVPDALTQTAVAAGGLELDSLDSLLSKRIIFDICTISKKVNHNAQ
jgi:hypothetical protein